MALARVGRTSGRLVGRGRVAVLSICGLTYFISALFFNACHCPIEKRAVLFVLLALIDGRAH